MKNKAVVHGAIDFAELENLGLEPAEIIDFSVNSNPYGPSPLAKAALTQVNIERYPDRDCLELRRTILEKDVPGAGLSLENLHCGNGTAELIWAVARAFLQPGTKAAIAEPTFGEYRQASRIAGAEVVGFQADASENFKLNASSLVAWLEKVRPHLLWLCNPNNPTGQLLGEAELQKIFESCHRNGIILVIDEAYQRFTGISETNSALRLVKEEKQGGLVVLRSLTKDYGLAGLRLGYVASNRLTIEKIARQLPSWNVNAAAQTVGAAALRDQPYLARTLGALQSERADFFAALVRNSLQTVPSATHFCLVEVGDGKAVRHTLLQNKILVRDCASFGLPGCIRVATRPEWPRLVIELKNCLKI